MSGGGSTERALTRDDVSFDVSRVRAPPFPCPVPGDPPACPCKVAPRPPPIFLSPRPTTRARSMSATRVNSRCPTWRYIPGRFIVGTTGSAPSAAVLAASTAFARPATPMPHHHTRPAAISAATPWRGTGNISTSRPHPARSTAISSIAGTHRETFSPEPTRTHPPSPIAQVQSVDPIQSIIQLTRRRRPTTVTPWSSAATASSARTSSGLSSATVTPSPRSTAGAASGSAIPKRFTPQTLTTSTQLGDGIKAFRGDAGYPRSKNEVAHIVCDRKQTRAFADAVDVATGTTLGANGAWDVVVDLSGFTPRDLRAALRGLKGGRGGTCSCRRIPCTRCATNARARTLSR